MSICRDKELHVIILAAGKGTRMKSSKAKVLHELFFAPMIHHVIDAIIPLQINNVTVVTGHQRIEVEESLSSFPVRFAHQKDQRGTGDAVLATNHMLAGKEGVVLILCGDTPLVKTETLKRMLEFHTTTTEKITVMTTIVEDPTNYGRIVLNDHDVIEKIVEEKDASVDQREIKEINAGIYCVDIPFLFTALSKIGSDNKQGEQYLTDIVAISTERGEAVNRFVCSDPLEVIGVNSRVELAMASKILQDRHNHDLMLAGVTMMDPSSVYVDKKSLIGKDTILYPNVFISGKSILHEGAVVHPYVSLHNCTVQANGVVNSFANYVDKIID